MAVPTLDWLDGFDHRADVGGVPSGSTSTPIYPVVNNTQGTGVSYVAGRRGGVALQIVEDGINATGVYEYLPTTSTRVFAGWFKLYEGSPGADSNILSVYDDSGVLIAEVRASAAGTIDARVGTAAFTTGLAVYSGVWNSLEFHLNTSSTTWSIQWRINGSTRTTNSEVGHAIVLSQRLLFGSTTAAHVAHCQWDDCIGSVDSADYTSRNYGNLLNSVDWVVKSVFPTGEGTDVIGSTNAITFTGAATGWQCVDDWIYGAASLADYITYASITTQDAASNYAEITFSDKDLGEIVWAVRGYAACAASSTLGDTLTVRIVDSANATLVDILALDDVSETTLRYWGKMIPAPSAGWTSGLNGVKARVGLSNDTDPLPYCSALLLQYATPVSSPTLSSLEGFDHQASVSTSTVPTGLAVYEDVDNPGSITYQAGRIGGYCLQVSESGSAATNVQHLISPPTSLWCFAGWFSITTLPTTDHTSLLLTYNSLGDKILTLAIRNAANGNVIEIQTGIGARETGPAITDTNWHSFECKVDISDGANIDIDWRIDGVAQSSGLEATAAAATPTDQVRFGTLTSTHNATVQWDDCIESQTAHDYIGRTWGSNWQIKGKHPNADGSHDTGSNNVVNQVPNQTNLWDSINDWKTGVIDTSTYLTYQSTSTGDAGTNWAEVTFEDHDVGDRIWGVMANVAAVSASAGNSSSIVKIRDFLNNTLADAKTGNNDSTMRYWRNMIPAPPAIGWASGFNDVKAQIGRSSDTSPLPRVSGVMLQYATTAFRPRIIVIGPVGI